MVPERGSHPFQPLRSSDAGKDVGFRCEVGSLCEPMQGQKCRRPDDCLGRLPRRESDDRQRDKPTRNSRELLVALETGTGLLQRNGSQPDAVRQAYSRAAQQIPPDNKSDPTKTRRSQIPGGTVTTRMPRQSYGGRTMAEHPTLHEPHEPKAREFPVRRGEPYSDSVRATEREDNTGTQRPECTNMDRAVGTHHHEMDHPQKKATNGIRVRQIRTTGGKRHLEENANVTETFPTLSLPLEKRIHHVLHKEGSSTTSGSAWARSCADRMPVTAPSARRAGYLRRKFPHATHTSHKRANAPPSGGTHSSYENTGRDHISNSLRAIELSRTDDVSLTRAENSKRCSGPVRAVNTSGVDNGVTHSKGTRRTHTTKSGDTGNSCSENQHRDTARGGGDDKHHAPPKEQPSEHSDHNIHTGPGGGRATRRREAEVTKGKNTACATTTTTTSSDRGQQGDPKDTTRTVRGSNKGIWDILNNLRQQDPYETPLWGGENELEKWLKIRLTPEQKKWELDTPHLPLIDTGLVMQLPDDGTRSLQEVKEALRYITDDDYFESKIVAPIRRKPKSRVSQEIQNNVETLVIADYMAPENEPKGRIGLFARAKPKKKLLRTIVDARPVNSAMEHTPPVELPGRDDVRRMVKKHAFVCELDGKGFFHQFPLTRKIRRWFCAMIRGQWYSWTRLPMGWAYSVYIAQAFSRWLTDNLGSNVEVLVYIDNVYIFGASKEDVEAAKDVFLQKCEQVNATFEISTPTGNNCQILGMTCDLANKEISMPSTLQEKLKEIHLHIQQLHTEKRLTYRLLWILLGNAVWGGRILGEPMCHYPNLLQWISEQSAKLTAGDKKWGDRAHLWPKARAQLAALIQKLAQNKPWKPAGDSAKFSVYTDASDIGYGIISSWEDTAYAGRWNADMQTKIIAERELHVAVAGVKRAIDKIL
eukprot:PhF_6_TR13256/c0_g1_i1/m.21016